MEIMKDNNINEMQISKSDISNILKDKFKNDLLKHIHSYEEGKKATHVRLIQRSHKI